MGIWGGALPPKSQFRFTLQYASCLAKSWPNYVIFTTLFQAWSKVLSSISNLVGLALHSQNMMRAATQENAFGLCVTQSVLLNGGSLKAYSLYTVLISLYISLFQIRKYSYIACDILGIQIVISKVLKTAGFFSFVLFAPSPIPEYRPIYRWKRKNVPLAVSSPLRKKKTLKPLTKMYDPWAHKWYLSRFLSGCICIITITSY